jgi:hypothetical protein
VLVRTAWWKRCAIDGASAGGITDIATADTDAGHTIITTTITIITGGITTITTTTRFTQRAPSGARFVCGDSGA